MIGVQKSLGRVGLWTGPSMLRQRLQFTAKLLLGLLF
jgi:hypothetical protein